MENLGDIVITYGIGRDGYILLNKSKIEEKAKYITDNWKDIENNSRLSKEAQNWSARFQLDWEMFKDVPESKRYGAIYDRVKDSVMSHERDHLAFYLKVDDPEKVKLSYRELLAYSESASEDIMGLEHAEAIVESSSKKDSKYFNAHEVASHALTYGVMTELGAKSKYELYHMPDLENKLKSASKSVYDSSKKFRKLDY